jgi:Fis family transcriptional regulator
MTNRAETLSDQTQASNDEHVVLGDVTNSSAAHGCLRDAVTDSVRAYLQQLDGQMTTDFYSLLLAEVEAPMLKEIMQYTRNNQTKASMMLGLNRGTLRKKLKQYGLITPEQNKD